MTKYDTAETFESKYGVYYGPALAFVVINK